jgi:hypothetical protein
MRSQLSNVALLLMGLAITTVSVTGSVAQNNKRPAMDEVINFASRPESDYTADVRAQFAQTIANYCQEILKVLPTNTPTEDAWVISEEKTGNGAKIQRLINSKEYGRSALKNTFSECKDTTTMLIEIQQWPKRGTETFSRLEAGEFIQLALNFNTFLEPYSSKIELNKDVKFALGDLQLHVVRTGLLRAARKALQDVH